ncbi:MAG: IS66 family transposase [Myxococcota bacterium]
MTREELLHASHATLIDLVVASQERLEEVEQQLRWFRKQLFGRKSERRILEPDPSQLCLGEGLAGESEPTAPTTTVRTHVRRKRPAREDPDESGLRFDDSVPVRTIEIPNPEIENLPEEARTEVSEKVTYRLAQRPGSYEVLKLVRKVVKRADTGTLSCPPAPPAVLEKSYADVSLLAGMLVDKFRYHLPLYRQHQRLQAAGITVSRASLTSWVSQAIELLEPIYHTQMGAILTSRVLAMDETPIRAGRKAKGKMRTGYFWPVYGDQHEVAFPYAPTRAKRHVEEILGSYCGTLLSDGYDAYDRYAERRQGVVHALCWVHTRRGFVKAQEVEPVRAQKALDFIGELYETEEEIRQRGLVGEAKLRLRCEQSRPVVEAFFTWLEEERGTSALLPTNPFTKAALYAAKRRKGLEVFLSDSEVPLDTNHLERALRVIPMGRKSWLFCWTELGAQQVGQIQSLLTTCVLHDVDPYTYLVDVLQRIDRHPYARVSELRPRIWKEHFANAPLRSLLDPSPP